MSRASFEMASPYLPVDGRQVGGKRLLPLVLCLGLVSVAGVVVIRSSRAGSGSDSSALGAAPALVTQTVSGTYSLRVSLEFKDGTRADEVQEGYKTLALDALTGRSYKSTQLRDSSGNEWVQISIEDPNIGLAIFFANSSHGSRWQSTCESFQMTGPRWPPEWTGSTADRARRSNNSECLRGSVPCEQSRRADAVRVARVESLSTFRSVLHEEVWSEWPAGGRVLGSGKRRTEDVIWAEDERGALSSIRKTVDVVLGDPEAFWNTSEVFVCRAVSAFNVTDVAVRIPDRSLFELQSSWGPCPINEHVEPAETLLMAVYA